MDFFHTYDLLPADPIFGLLERFKKDTNPEKHNLSVGVYYSETGEQFMMPSVKKAATEYVTHQLAAGYQPIRGSDPFLAAISKLLYGSSNVSETMAMVQTIGGTCALRVGAEVLLRGGYKNLYLSDPSWANHRPIFEEAGMRVETYPYLNRETMTLDFEALVSFVEQVEAKSVLLLHTCCHNPTGIDLSDEQWSVLLELANKKQCVCFFDFAYLGFARGVEEDSFAMRHCLEKGYAFMCAFSCSKTFTLYGERIGALMIQTKNSETKKAVQSHTEQVVRRFYSNPPRFGASLVTTILNSDELKKSWQSDLAMIRSRTSSTREYLVKHLQAVASEATVSSLKHGFGFFSLLGLNKAQVDQLYAQWIYLTGSSRINLAALNQSNIHAFIDGLKKVS